MNDNFRQIQAILREHAGFARKGFLPQYQFRPRIMTLRRSSSIMPQSITIRTQQANPLTGNSLFPAAKDLPEIAYFFGLVYQPGNAQIVHSLSTTLIGPSGRIENYLFRQRMDSG